MSKAKTSKPRKGLPRKSAEWYILTAWTICKAANDSPSRIKAEFEKYTIPLRDSQIAKLKTAINTRYKLNITNWRK